MRCFSCLAIAVAALTSIACGGPTIDAGNVYVSEAALEGVDANASRLVTVAVDVEDHGCTVDGLRFERCTLTRTSTIDVSDRPLKLCELEVDTGASYTWECDARAADAVNVKELPWHCPSGR